MGGPPMPAAIYEKGIKPRGKAQKLRALFLENLKKLQGPSITLVNDLDDTSPPIEFDFITESIIGKGVEPVDPDFMSGCICSPENGRLCGCELRACKCLDLSARDSKGNVNFPYSVGKFHFHCLRSFYLESRHHIYECNARCNCRSNCKNKVVQRGRQLPLEIFKTKDRGWGKQSHHTHYLPRPRLSSNADSFKGLRCSETLQKGQFIDTYRGEIITDEEAVKREQKRSLNDNNYLMNLDKHTPLRLIFPEEVADLVTPNEFQDIKDRVDKDLYETSKDDETGNIMWLNPFYKPPYVIDGMNHGSPSRFMNHSCDPNCRLFTVSQNHADTRIYDIAFFTLQVIPAGTELTFDYKDEEDRTRITDEMAHNIFETHGYMPTKCLCGTKSCRGYFFT